MARHPFLAVAALLAVLALATGRVALADLPRVEDGRLLLTLLALILSVEMIRGSRLLDHAVRLAVARFSRARSLCFALVLASGTLAGLVTNDVALFVVIPFTVAAARHSNFRVRNAVILEIVAVNLLGCVTPLGNPQNLYLYHLSGMTAPAFVATMLPFFAASLALLAGAVWLMEPRRRIEPVHAELLPLELRGALAGASGVLLVLLEIVRVVPPALAAAYSVLAAAAILRRRTLRVNLALLAIFFFVFIDMAAVHSFDFAGLYGRLPLPADLKLYLAGALLPQGLSNVPTAVLLAPVARGRFRILLYAVNAGGCGTLIASLANLIGWQIYSAESGRNPVFLRRLTATSFLFLAAVGTAGYLLA